MKHMNIPSASERLAPFLEDGKPVQIAVCDLTASCTFRWHHCRARGMAALDELAQILVLVTSSAANGATQNGRWKRECEQGRESGSLVDEIDAWICQTQAPIYWDVYSFMELSSRDLYTHEQTTKRSPSDARSQSGSHPGTELGQIEDARLITKPGGISPNPIRNDGRRSKEQVQGIRIPR